MKSNKNDSPPSSTRLSLNQVIGGILSALIDGQQQATNSLLNFIEQAKNQTITFNFKQPAEKNSKNLEPIKIEIPLLSIVPIPYMHISGGEIKFNFSVSSAKKETLKQSPSKNIKSNTILFGDISSIPPILANEDKEDKLINEPIINVIINMEKQSLLAGEDVIQHSIEKYLNGSNNT